MSIILLQFFYVFSSKTAQLFVECYQFRINVKKNVKYIENHYAQGNGSGKKTLNPVTKIYVGENSVFTLETTQILSLIHI